MTDETIEEVSAWFQQRGLDIALSLDSGVWWASLSPVENPATVISRFGQGESREAAALRARERYEQEQ
jgi:hypothetical protein